MQKPKDKAPDKKAKQDKIRGMSKMQRSKDLETSWRTGKQPASGYNEEDDPEFADADDMAGGSAAAGGEPDGDEGGALPATDPANMYMGPENGPFMCSNCVFFMGDNQPCQKVSDPVNAEGCCNQFQPAGGDQGGGDQDMGMGAQGAPSAAPQPNPQAAY